MVSIGYYGSVALVPSFSRAFYSGLAMLIHKGWPSKKSKTNACGFASWGWELPHHCKNDMFLRKIQQTPGTYPRYLKLLIWKDFLYKDVCLYVGVFLECYESHLQNSGSNCKSLIQMGSDLNPFRSLSQIRSFEACFFFPLPNIICSWADSWNLV